MIGTIIYIIGIILGVKAVLEILNTGISTGGKIISILLLLLTSWIGLIVYYMYAKDHLYEWFR